MDPLILHKYHEGLQAKFTDVNGTEVVAQYNSVPEEHLALTHTAGVLDLSFRGRICLTGEDRARFLHGQVTNDIKNLSVGRGCYAALVTAKGRMQSDLSIYCLADEFLLDFEPGLTAKITGRLRKYIVADDVEVVDVAGLYGLLSVQGPQAALVVEKLELFSALPAHPFHFSKINDPVHGELYLVAQPRLGTAGFDLFVPVSGLAAIADKLTTAARSVGGSACGWNALEIARVEAGLPRFGADMDETHLPQESRIESQAVSYTKGCYIGQEVLNRLHTLGHVNRELQGLCLDDTLSALPQKGDKLFHEGKEVGSITSAVRSLRWNKNIALGYVRREVAQQDTALTLTSANGQSTARVVPLPFAHL